MPQAIVCTPYSVTNTLPARVRVSGSGGCPAIWVSRHALRGDTDGEQMAHAAQIYAEHFDWRGKWHGQEMRDHWVFIVDPTPAFVVGLYKGHVPVPLGTTLDETV